MGPPAHHCVGAAPINLNHSSMAKASVGINILAVLPLASNAGSTVLAEMIVPAIIARTASKYFRIVVIMCRKCDGRHTQPFSNQ
jgi:hypothetical protein